MQMWDRHDNPNQLWRFEKQGDASYIIRSVLSDLVLDIERYGKENGSRLHLWTQHGDWNQRFFLEEVVHLPG